MHTSETREVRNKKIQEIISNFKYISKQKGSAEMFKVSIPMKTGSGANVIWCKTLRKAISTRNRIGRKIWGDYWPAVLSGFIDTIKSENASVYVGQRVDKRRGYKECYVSFRRLEDHKQVTRNFSCQKYGEQKAMELAMAYAAIETESRLKRLSKWDPRLIRKPRENREKGTCNRGSGAGK